MNTQRGETAAWQFNLNLFTLNQILLHRFLVKTFFVNINGLSMGYFSQRFLTNIG